MIFISKAMDGFTMEKEGKDGELSLVEGLRAAQMPALVIGVQTDVLFPVWQQKQIADSLRAAGNKQVCYYELDSMYGHDAFLLEQQAIGPAVKGHLEQEPGGAAHLWQDMAHSASLILQASLHRGNPADKMRDIFRTLAEGAEVVETAKLRRVLKVVTMGRCSEEHIDKIFNEKLPEKTVSLSSFMSIREVLEMEQTNAPGYSI